MQYLLLSFPHYLLNFFPKKRGEKAISYVQKDWLGQLNLEVLSCRDQYDQSVCTAQLHDSAFSQQRGSCNSLRSHARALPFPKGAAPHLSPAACPSLQTVPCRKNKSILKGLGGFTQDQQESTGLQGLPLAQWQGWKRLAQPQHHFSPPALGCSFTKRGWVRS